MDYQQLLSRLTDLRLPAYPAPEGERGGCMSSYDRASAYDDKTDTYLHWDANDDGSGCIRQLEDGSIVAFECEGPGVIWRVWSALPQTGHMRIFFDDAVTPEVDLPFIDWFESQPGDVPPLNLSELSLRLSRGRNSFIPIPFQKYCRVELAPGWGAYYHFTYTRFPQGTQMPAYRERFSRTGMIALAQTDRLLYARGETQEPDNVTASALLPPGETMCLLQENGEGIIREMAFLPHAADPDTLRALVLRIYWDGEDRPAVEAPVGDFFGGSPAYAHYRCLPMSMEQSRFSCRFVMPFQKGCRVDMTNHGSKAVQLSMAFRMDHSPGCAQGMLRFHAKWHRGFWGSLNKARYAPDSDRWPDWPLLLVHGAQGRFVGVHLHIHNTWKAPDTTADSWWYGQWDRKTVDWWWGEGDEKFFVDGERFPSTFGTGSEDYIGYAWAAEPPFALFDSPFAAMNQMPIDGNGDTSVCRFHIADNIPFSDSFEGFIEKYKADQWENSGKCLYAATPYWYQEAGTSDDYPPIPPKALRMC